VSPQLIINWKRPRRTLSLPELNEYPETQVVELYPAFLSPDSHRISFSIHHQALLELNFYPETPGVELYPAWVGVDSNKIQFNITRQTLNELNRYQNFAPITAWETQFNKIKNVTNRQLNELPILSSYPQIQIVEFYPGFLAPDSHRISFDIGHQLLPELNTRPLAPSEVTLPAFLEPIAFKSKYERVFLSESLDAALLASAGAVAVIGFLKGEISVFSAYNGEIKVINALTGEVSVINPLKIQ